MNTFSEIKHYVELLITNFSNVHLNLYILFTITILFLAFHALRNKPILSTISIGFSFFPVLIHELGHAFTAQIVGGRVDDIRMVLSQKKQQESGKQGYAVTRANHKLKFVVITFFGYVAPPLMLFSGVYFAYNDMTFIFLLLCLLFLVFYFIMTSQKWIPLILLLIVGYACYNIIIQQYSLVTASTSFIYNVLLGLLLGETIQSIIITTKTTFSKQSSEWDGSAMRSLTFLPVTFWWFVWTFISAVSMYKVFIIFVNL